MTLTVPQRDRKTCARQSRKEKGTPVARRPTPYELLAAFKKEGKAMSTRENTHRMADANKAFAHFAW